jgi:hypothetical protein
VRAHDVSVDDLDRLGDLAPVCRRQASHPAIPFGKRKLLDLSIMAAGNSQASAAFVRTELTPWKKPRQRIREPRTELLDTGNVDCELFDEVGERNGVRSPTTKIRRKDSKG